MSTASAELAPFVVLLAVCVSKDKHETRKRRMTDQGSGALERGRAQSSDDESDSEGAMDVTETQEQVLPPRNIQIVPV